METSYFFSSIEKTEQNAQFINEMAEFSNNESKQVYILDKPLGENKYKYDYQNVAVVLIPKSKITFVNFGIEQEEFGEYVQDFIEDLGAISDKFRYKDVIGRPRSWKDKLTYILTYEVEKFDCTSYVNEIQLDKGDDQKKCELIISLLTGSINNIERVGSNIPDNLLDKVKQKIILFDGDQTRFIYTNPTKHVIKIQGLSGTGKTELLLHKMKDIYVGNEMSKILFTCHNKILANSLQKRIPDFFNFMKVEQQIQWDERFFCFHAWGSQAKPYSGAYAYICNFYEIPFGSFSRLNSFDDVCTQAIKAIDSLKKLQGDEFKYAFDYAFIDEGQDFKESFIELCSRVTRSTVYVAGDIFQSIFESGPILNVSPDHLLSKCYRTDPRTLMFAHGLGMGLFEKFKLRWLKDQEWKTCGYTFDKKESTYYLKREPLRRFEDLQTSKYRSVNIVECVSQDLKYITNCIIDLLNKIKDDNPTVSADDIGIIFLDGSKDAYSLADYLEQYIPRAFGWFVNKAYETKQKMRDRVLISNKNNVKGLEFPFVICVTSEISNSYSYRNTLYTMLTRSFLQSTLLITNKIDEQLKLAIDNALNDIYTHGYMKVEEPSAPEKLRISATIQQKENQQSLYDLFYSLCDEKGIDSGHRKKLYASFQKLEEKIIDAALLEEWIDMNYSILLRFGKIKK